MDSSTNRGGRDAGDGPALTVVVTHYKSVPALEASLRSVRDAVDLERTEVVVADSEEQPGTRQLVHGIVPGATFLGFADDVGYAVSVNAALRVTTAPYVLVLNADVRVGRDTVERLVGALEHDPSLGLVGPVLRYDDGTRQDSAFRFYRPTTVLHRRTATGRTPWGRAALRRFEEPSRQVERADGELVPTDWLLGAAVVLRRSALASVGPVDVRYFMYFEDVDWCLRFWRAGWRVAVVPGAEAHHTYGRASRGKGPKALLTNEMARIHVRSAITFFGTHGLRPTRDAAVPAPLEAAPTAVGAGEQHR